MKPRKLSKKEMSELIPMLDKLSKAFAMMGISAKEAAVSFGNGAAKIASYQKNKKHK